MKLPYFVFVLVVILGYVAIHEIIHSEISRYFSHDDCYFGTNGISVYQHCPDRYNTSYDIIEEMKLQRNIFLYSFNFSKQTSFL